MKLKTRYHGTIEYDEKEVIKFEKGLPGFEELKKFIIFPVEEDSPFNILHSIEDDEVGFTVVSPFYVDSGYEFNVDDDKIKGLKIKGYDDLLILCTLTLNSDIKKITANMKAPIIINIKEKLGEQIVLDSEKYLIKYPVFKE